MANTPVAAAKATPAKKAATPKKAVSVDLGSLTAVDAAAPTRHGGGRERSELVKYLEGLLKDSANGERTQRRNGGWVGKGKMVNPKVDEASTVVSALRRAATNLNMGVTVTDHEDPSFRKGSRVEITFAAKSRTNRQRKNAAQ